MFFLPSSAPILGVFQQPASAATALVCWICLIVIDAWARLTGYADSPAYFDRSFADFYILLIPVPYLASSFLLGLPSISRRIHPGILLTAYLSMVPVAHELIVRRFTAPLLILAFVSILSGASYYFSRGSEKSIPRELTLARSIDAADRI